VLRFIGSLLLIIVLLYFLSRFVSGKAAKMNRSGPFHSIGGYSLGNNKSIQLIMIGSTLYIIGVGQDVRLIRSVPPGDEQKELLESVASHAGEIQPKWFFRKKTKKEKWDHILLEQIKELESHSVPPQNGSQHEE
jgi:flagellar protein FliO/FliZ